MDYNQEVVFTLVCIHFCNVNMCSDGLTWLFFNIYFGLHVQEQLTFEMMLSFFRINKFGKPRLFVDKFMMLRYVSKVFPVYDLCW